MSHLQTWAAKNADYSQTVRVGDALHLSGLGGWNEAAAQTFPADANDELAQAFVNVDRALREAGATKGWGAVYKVRVYAAPLNMDIPIMELLRKWCPEQRPALTAIGVARLYLDMRFEVEVEAHLGGQ